jgi:hypothetical protein
MLTNLLFFLNSFVKRTAVSTKKTIYQRPPLPHSANNHLAVLLALQGGHFFKDIPNQDEQFDQRENGFTVRGNAHHAKTILCLPPCWQKIAPILQAIASHSIN